jgi:hypothetical protein
MIPAIGFEGAVILSVIAIVSLGLAGIRFSFANVPRAPGDQPAGRALPIRVVARTGTETASGGQSNHGFITQLTRLIWAISSFPLRLFRSIPEEKSVKELAPPCDPISQLVSPVPDCPQTRGAKVGARDADWDERMDTQTQWDRVSRVVEGGIEKANEIETLHEAAGRQLDAVDYAYERMLLELSEVLPDVTENRTVCRANRDEAYAEAADLDQISTEMAQQLVAACEPAKRKSQKKRESQKSVAA